MNYEQRYKKALERAREYKKHGYMMINAALDNIFPELKESEDEWIRKDLITYLKADRDYNPTQSESFYERSIAWLEKQGSKPQGKTALESIKEEKVDNENKVVDFKAEDWYVSKVDGKIHNFYYSDKPEPKFKLGDWVVTDKDDIVQIGAVNPGYYTLNNGMDFSTSFVDKYWRLWTIKAAKEGDVLVDVYGNIGIYEKCDDFDWASYCSLGFHGGFQNFKVEHENDKTHPATKEQRDLLFQKMEDEGYWWDSENKELKKGGLL